LTVTICLAPLGVMLVLVLAVVNLMGWTVASQIVGERVVKLLNQEVQPVLTVVVGAVLLTAAAALLWVFDCLRPLAFLFVLTVSSFGTGAFLVPWVNRRKEVIPPAPPADVRDETGAPPAPLAVWQPPVSTPVVQAPEASAPREPEAELPPVADEPPVSTEAPVAEASAEASAESLGEIGVGDDEFTRIKGVGPVFERRLKAAGIRTFADLAATQAEKIAEIIGWPVDRVLRSEIREQAQRLAQGG
jgi:predicted flap endonuclease-1-like 5' DNA nuclease